MCWCLALILLLEPGHRVSMVWFGCALIFIVVMAAIYGLAKLAPRMKLLAIPGGHRLHESPTPMVGGIGVYLGLLLGLFVIDASFINLMPSLLLLCVVGALDDRYSLPSWQRFLAQGIAAYLMVKLTGAQLNTLGYLVSSDKEVLLGRWSIPLTVFAAIGVINAVNMSDGIDGLAGSMVFLVILTLLAIGAPSTSLSLAALMSVAGFLFWNLRILRSNAAVFMGDAGSTMLGLLTAYLLITFSQTLNGIPAVTALWLLALPLIDAVTVLLVRPLRGRSPFAADRIHYHHQLADIGLGVNSVLIVSLVLQGLFIMIGIVLWRVNAADSIQLLAFLLLFGVYFSRLIWYTRDKTFD